MTASVQKRLAVIGALVAFAIFVVANAHLIAVAFRSQPDCIIADGPAAPAKRAC